MFCKSKEALKCLWKLMECVTCSEVPAKEVWVSDSPSKDKVCCEKCVLSLQGKPWFIGTINDKKSGDPHVDPFTSNLLRELKQFEKFLDEKNSTNEPKQAAFVASLSPLLVPKSPVEHVGDDVVRIGEGELTVAATAIWNFDRIPNRDPNSPDFAYKSERAVRKKAERAKLPGWDCDMCRDYYEAIASELTDEEMKKLKNKCSKHRSKYPVSLASSPPNYWDPDFPTTQECIDRKYMGIGVRSPVVAATSPLKRRSMDAAAVKKTELQQPKFKIRRLNEKAHLKSLHVVEKHDKQLGKLGKNNKRSSSISNVASSNNESLKSNATTNNTSLTSLDSSMSVEKRNSKGETPLHIACRNGQTDKVKQLLELGADINAKDFAGWTPLHEAINSKGSDGFQIISLLCDAGCQVNTPGLDNETPLHESVRLGKIRTIKFLLSHRASLKLRNKHGHLARDATDNGTIIKILEDFKGPYLREPNDEDFIEVVFKNSVTFFTYEEDKDLLQTYKIELNARVVEQFGSEVTHAIFSSREVKNGRVPFSVNYLLSVLNGSWLLNSKWVVNSANEKKITDPRKFEIMGCFNHPKSLSTSYGKSEENVPARSRNNRELGNPGLFHGLNFYVHRTCSFEKLTKQDLTRLIIVGDGKVINREPAPDSVDPMDNPYRFHAQEQNHKMILTSHIILYGDGNEPGNKFNMEHLKTLRADWLFSSILNFKLMDPNEFL